MAPAENIFQELLRTDKAISWENDTISSFEITKDQYLVRKATFKKIIFSDHFSLNEIDTKTGISFIKCEFNLDAFFINLFSSPRVSRQILSFTDCIFHGAFYFDGEGNNLSATIKLTRCIFHKSFDIINTNLNGDILLSKCSVAKHFTLENLLCSGIAIISSSNLSSSNFTNITAKSLNFRGDNNFKGDVYVDNGKLGDGISFNGGLYEKEVLIEAIETQKKGLSVINSTFNKVFNLTISSKSLEPFGIIKFRGAKFNDGISVVGGKQIEFDYPVVDTIDLNITFDFTGHIRFSHLTIRQLWITGYSTSTNIQFVDLFAHHINLHKFINSAGLIFSRVKSLSNYEDISAFDPPKIGSSFSIVDSNLGNTQLFQVDLSSFFNIKFDNAILSDISFSNIEWFKQNQFKFHETEWALGLLKIAKRNKDLESIKKYNLELLEIHLSKKEAFRQLKVAAQKQSDIPMSLEFQGWEMNSYRKWRKCKSNTSHTFWEGIKMRSESLILWSSLSNDFGQNWLKAFGIFIIASFVCFIPIGFLISPDLDFNSWAASWHDVLENIQAPFKNIKHWFVVMNPTHNFKDISESISHLSGWVYFWDFISRVVSAYFIFQIVSAFRKFNKQS
ncbi:MAG: hypothetical protein V4557_14770 [Bacteroidota bacterium]